MKGRSKSNGFGNMLSIIKKGKSNPKNKIKPIGFGDKLKKQHQGGENISKAKKGKSSGKKGKTYGALKDSYLKNINRKKIVLQIDVITNNIIKEWESRSKINKEIGGGIARAIQTGKIYKNSYWMYKNIKL